MSTNRILLPKFETQKDKDGKYFYGRLPYEYTFSNKEEYLTWRKIWKETYKELSISIRESKNLRNEGFRNKIDNVYKHQCDVLIKKEQARSLLEILKQGKQLSWLMKQKHQEN